jgi:hypothetical protein
LVKLDRLEIVPNRGPNRGGGRPKQYDKGEEEGEGEGRWKVTNIRKERAASREERQRLVYSSPFEYNGTKSS